MILRTNLQYAGLRLRHNMPHWYKIPCRMYALTAPVVINGQIEAARGKQDDTAK